MKVRKGLTLHPIDVATNETVAFLLRHLSARPLRLLEVGSGTGEVAGVNPFYRFRHTFDDVRPEGEADQNSLGHT